MEICGKKLRVGVLGAKGRFGSRIVRQLNEVEGVDLVWLGGADDAWWEVDSLDWIVCATPHEFHFEHAKHFLEIGTNVLLEKPGTLSSESLTHLLELAIQKGVKLYVDDIYRYKDPAKFTQVKFDYFSPTTDSNFVDLIAYHHFYLLYFQDAPSGEVEIGLGTCSQMEAEFTLAFSSGQFYNFSYNLRSRTRWDSLNYTSSLDALTRMLEAVFSGTADFQGNARGALFATRMSEKLKLTIFGRGLVVGGGVYGCASAVKLAKLGYSVDLFEKNKDLISGASWVNQYRVHLGFHYPRSAATRGECISASREFYRQFGRAVVTTTDHHYAISNSNSYLGAAEYLKAMDESGLDYKKLSSLPNTSLTILTQEAQFNPRVLREIFEERLFGMGVTLKAGQEFTTDANDPDSPYRISVYATYARTNDFRRNKRLFKFQLVEKIVVQLPEYLGDFSLVVMDGPFFSIDPLPGTNLHVVGAVLAANHDVRKSSEPPPAPLNFRADTATLVHAPTTSNKEAIISLVKSYLGDLPIQYRGSYFVTKALKTDVDRTDERLHDIDVDLENRSIHLLGGKVSAATLAADKVSEIVRMQFLQDNITAHGASDGNRTRVISLED